MTTAVEVSDQAGARMKAHEAVTVTRPLVQS